MGSMADTNTYSKTLLETLSISVPWFVLRVISASNLYFAYALIAANYQNVIASFTFIEPFRFFIEALSIVFSTATFIAYTLDIHKNNTDGHEAIRSGLISSILFSIAVILSYYLLFNPLIGLLIIEESLKNNLLTFLDLFILNVIFQSLMDVFDRYMIFHNYRISNFIISLCSELSFFACFYFMFSYQFNLYACMASALVAKRALKLLLDIAYLSIVDERLIKNMLHLEVNFRMHKEIFSISLPLFIQTGFKRLVSLIKILTKAFFGVQLLATYGMASQILYYPLIAIYALSEASFIMISKEDSTEKRNQTLQSHFYYLTILSAIIAIGLALYPNTIINLFFTTTVTQDIVSTVTQLLFLSTIHYYLKGINLLYEKYLCSYGATDIVNQANIVSSLLFEVLPAVLLMTANMPSLALLICAEIIGDIAKAGYYHFQQTHDDNSVLCCP